MGRVTISPRSTIQAREQCFWAATYLIVAVWTQSLSPLEVGPRVWFPSGVAMGGILWHGPRLLPGLLLGGMLAGLELAILLGARGGEALVLALAQGLAPVVEAYLGWLIFRKLNARPMLDRSSDILPFVALSLVAPIAGALLWSLGLTFLDRLTPIQFVARWHAWWVRDMVGILAFAPALMAWLERPEIIGGWVRVVEGATLTVLILIISGLGFGSGNPIFLLIMPLILWATLRFGRRGASTATLLSSVLAVSLSAGGKDPTGFNSIDLIDPGNELGLPIYLAMLAITAQFLGAILSERRRSEAALRESEHRYRAIVEDQTELVCRFLPTGQLSFVNDAFCRYFHRSRESLLEETLWELFPENSRDLTRDRLLHISAESSVAQVEMEVRRGDGAIRRHLWADRAIFSAEGQLVEYQAVGRDITERKQLELELRSAKESAESANAAKTAFLANMSHEIRTPITAILGYADMVLDPALDDLQHNQSLWGIRRNSQHLLQIVDDILDLSKIEAGKLVYEILPTNPAQLIQDVGTALRGRALEKGLKLDVHAIGLLPRTVTTDPTRIRQILVNLVGNAIKFTESGSVRLRLSMVDAVKGFNHGAGTHGNAQAAGWLRYDVEDDGDGMTADQVSQLFQPFHQADASTTRKHGGTGLGLSISKRLANALGGDIQVWSKRGVGSRFSVLLPVPASELEDLVATDWHATRDLSPRESTLVRPASAGGLRGRVLLAEDGKDNQQVLSYYLRTAGLDVVIAENGQEAIDLTLRADETPDLILMDIQMPVLDGYQAIRALRAAGFNRPIVALTAHALSSDRAQCFEAGSTAYLTKPVDPNLLQATLSRLLTNVTTTTSTTTSASPPQKANEPGLHASRSPEPISIGLGMGMGTGADSTAGDSIADLLADDEGFHALVEEYARELPDRARELREAVLAQDWNTLKRLAHQAKGASGMYGYPELSAVAARLERAAVDGHELSLINDHLARIDLLVRAILTEMGLSRVGSQ